MSSDGFGPPQGWRMTGDQIRYEMGRRAASQLGRADPDVPKIARSSTVAEAAERRFSDSIGARINGFADPPAFLSQQARIIDLRGKSTRMEALDPLSRTLAMVQNLDPPQQVQEPPEDPSE